MCLLSSKGILFFNFFIFSFSAQVNNLLLISDVYSVELRCNQRSDISGRIFINREKAENVKHIFARHKIARYLSPCFLLKVLWQKSNALEFSSHKLEIRNSCVDRHDYGFWDRQQQQLRERDRIVDRIEAD